MKEMNIKKIRQQFADTLLEVGKSDPNLVVLIGDISHFILQPFARACPGRFYNIGICEPTIVSMAAGLSKMGFYPVVHTIAPFILERSFEQIKLDFCYQKLRGNLITVGSAFDYSNLGCTHHCYDDFALIKSLPNTQIIYPASCLEFDTLFRQTYNNEYLTLFRVPEKQHGQLIEASLIKFGKAIKMTDGDDVTIVVTGPQLKNALDAKAILSNQGFSIEVIYVHTLLPLDTALIKESVRKTKNVLVIEEHNWIGGLGQDVLAAVYDIGGIKQASLALNNFIHDYGNYEELCAKSDLSAEGIIRIVKDNFSRKR